MLTSALHNTGFICASILLKRNQALFFLRCHMTQSTGTGNKVFSICDTRLCGAVQVEIPNPAKPQQRRQSSPRNSNQFSTEFLQMVQFSGKGHIFAFGRLITCGQLIETDFGLKIVACPGMSLDAHLYHRDVQYSSNTDHEDHPQQLEVFEGDKTRES